jgi:hypothetical protein
MTDDMLKTLVDDYPGDAAWRKFSEYWSAMSGCEDRRALIYLLQDEDLAAVVAGRMGEHAASWVNKEVPALGKRTPVDIVRQSNGKTILRSLLIRMP